MGGTKTVPLGAFEDPPPEDAPTIKSVRVKRNAASIAALKATQVADAASDFIDSLNPIG